jgi:hypothetical protein
MNAFKICKFLWLVTFHEFLNNLSSLRLVRSHHQSRPSRFKRIESFQLFSAGKWNRMGLRPCDHGKNA